MSWPNFSIDSYMNLRFKKPVRRSATYTCKHAADKHPWFCSVDNIAPFTF